MIEFIQPNVTRIYLDMDGPLVDDVEMWSRVHPDIPNLRAYIQKLKVFGQKQTFMYPTVLKCIEENHFATGALTPFALFVKEILLPFWEEKGIEVEILSSTMSNNPMSTNLAEQKLQWLDENGFGHLPCNLVPGSARKQEYAQEGYLLIDDYDRTIGQFISNGGYAVHFTNTNDVMDVLRLLDLAPNVQV